MPMNNPVDKQALNPLNEQANSQLSGQVLSAEDLHQAPVLKLEGIKKSFEGQKVLENVNLQVWAGEILCLTGPSGIGKSTLLEIMAGVIKPDAGTVRRGGKVSLAFQDDVLIPWLDALQNLLYIRENIPFSQNIPQNNEQHSSTQQKSLEDSALRHLQDFALAPTAFPSAMSGGMRRRLNLARAFFAAAPLILLDEPFAFLDETWQKIVVGKILQAAQNKAAVVLSSHSLTPFSMDKLNNFKIMELG